MFEKSRPAGRRGYDDPVLELALGAAKVRGKISEVMAFLEMLREDFEASPDRVDTSVVAEIRGRLMKAWKGFNRADREAVGTAPALWITYRSLLRFGEDRDRRKIRSTIAGFIPASQSGTGSRGGNFRGGAYALISSEALRMAS